MKTFIFLVTMWTSDGRPPEVLVVEDGLTGEACIALLASYQGEGTPSCEIDHGV